VININNRDFDVGFSLLLVPLFNHWLELPKAGDFVQ